jgi:hypothetical protein
VGRPQRDDVLGVAGRLQSRGGAALVARPRHRGQAGGRRPRRRLGVGDDQRRRLVAPSRAEWPGAADTVMRSRPGPGRRAPRRSRLDRGARPGRRSAASAGGGQVTRECNTCRRWSCRVSNTRRRRGSRGRAVIEASSTRWPPTHTVLRASASVAALTPPGRPPRPACRTRCLLPARPPTSGSAALAPALAAAGRPWRRALANHPARQPRRRPRPRVAVAAPAGGRGRPRDPLAPPRRLQRPLRPPAARRVGYAVLGQHCHGNDTDCLHEARIVDGRRHDEMVRRSRGRRAARQLRRRFVDGARIASSASATAGWAWPPTRVRACSCCR